MNDLFVSYARADDESFVRWLYEELRADGLTIWFDRESMPSRSLTFLHEIRAAIDEADRVLVVVGPSALASDYVRSEWQHAQAADKIVLPVLRTGEYSDLPAEFRNLHTVDFRAKRDRRQALVELRRVLSDPIPTLGIVHGDVPALPPHFQPRPDQLSQVADALLIDLEEPVTITGPAAFLVLYGMGGIGKSVLAASFARSTAARRSFPDGVFWIRVGESLESRVVAQRLSRALPGASGETIGSDVTARIRGQLAGKRALVVLDDVANVEQLEAVSDVADLNTRLLVTARYADVMIASGSRGLELGGLTESAAARLLADWLDTATDRLPPEAPNLARECGYHPLALALNGAMLRKGVSWDALIAALRAQELDYAEIRLAHYPYETVQRSLQVSFDALTRFDRDGASQFRALAALNWAAGVPEATIARLWRHRGDLASRQAMKLLSELEQRALLRTEGRAPDRTVRIHDLQLAHLRQRPADLVALNGDVLAAYWAECDGDWSRGPADGYFHNNLVVHLLASDRSDEVHRLLGQERDSRNAWHQTMSDLGLVDRWFDDIDAASALLTQQNIPEHTPRLGLQVRYTLMKSSVQSQASGIPSALLELCAQHGIITFAKALSFGRAASLDEQQVDALRCLLPLAPAEVRPALESEAVGIALSIQAPSRQIWALHRLIPVLSAERASRAFAFVRSVPDDDYRSALLPELARVVPPDEIDDVHAIARRLGRLASTETLATLASRVANPADVLDEAAGVAAQLRVPWKKVRALCFIAQAVEPTRRFDLMDLALDAARKIDSSFWLVNSLVTMAPFLAAAQLDQALEQAPRLANDDERVQLHFALVPHLPQAQREELVAREVELHRPRKGKLPWGAHNAAILASDLPSDMLPTIGPSELSAIVHMATLPHGIFTVPRPMRERRWQYDAALEVLGSRLPDRYVPAAVDLLQQVHDGEDRAEILGRLTPRLPKADRRHVLAAEYQRVLAVSDTAPRARTLAACSAYAPKAERSEIADESLRLIAQSGEAPAPHPAHLIAAAAAQLPPERALAVIAGELDWLANEDPRRRDEALATLVPSLPPTHLPRAVELARSTVPDHCYLALAKLVGRLEDLEREAAVAEFLEAASGWVAIELPTDFRKALGDTVEWMSPSQVVAAFDIAQSVTTDAEFAGMLQHLAARLPRKQLDEARTRAKHMSDRSVRVSALVALASSGVLTAKARRALTGNILRLSYSIAADDQRARTLVVAASVAGADRQQVLDDALAAANRVVEDDERATLFCQMLTELARERALATFGEMLRASLGRRRSGSFGGNPFYADLGRPFLLSMLEEAAPWFGNLDDPPFVSHVVQSVRDVARWWP